MRNTEAAKLYHLSTGTVAAWKKSGVNFDDAREVVKHARSLRRVPAAWAEALGGIEGEATLDELKKIKLRYEGERVRLAAEKERGDLIPRAEAERIGLLWTEALKHGLKAMAAEFTHSLAGLSEAEVETIAEGKHDELLHALSDLDSQLWSDVIDGGTARTGKKMKRVGTK